MIAVRTLIGAAVRAAWCDFVHRQVRDVHGDRLVIACRDGCPTRVERAHLTHAERERRRRQLDEARRVTHGGHR